MPIYEYECNVHGKFERLESLRGVGTSLHDYTSPCPDCSIYCESVLSVFSHRMAENFSVLDSGGKVVQKQQVVNDTPPWDDPAVRVEVNQPSNEPILVRDRGGNIYYNRGRK